MTCLSCPHLVIDTWSDHRVFYCGHDSESELDSNDRAVMITALEFGSDGKVDRPVWCPFQNKKESHV